MVSKDQKSNAQVAEFLGKLFSFNNSLKLYHWHVTGPASYAQHIALDQAIESLSETLDGLVETSYALLGDLEIAIPETKRPNDIVQYATDFYQYVENQRSLFTESFSEGLIDNYQEGIQQLLYRVIRLK